MDVGLDYGAARFWMDFGALIAVGINAVYTWFTGRTKANKTAIEKMDSKVAGVSSRLTAIEADLRHAPSRSDIDELHERVTIATNELGQVRGELHSMNRTLTLIHQSLLDERIKK